MAASYEECSRVLYFSKVPKKKHPFFLPNSYNFKSQGVFLIMYDVSKKSVLNFHVCTFFFFFNGVALHFTT